MKMQSRCGYGTIDLLVLMNKPQTTEDSIGMYIQRLHLQRVGLVLLLALLALFTVAACGGADDAAADEETTANSTTTGPLKFVYIYAADCAPCEQMTPIIDELAAEYAAQLVVEKYDAASDEGKKYMVDYSLSTNPSYVILSADGSKLWSNTGQIHQDMLRQQLTALLR